MSSFPANTRVRRGLAKWPAVVACPETTLHLDLHGTAGVYVAPIGWHTEQKLGDDHLVYFLSEGSFLARVHDTEFSLHAGSLLWVCPGSEIHFRRDDDRRLVLRRFRMRVALADGRPVVLSTRYLVQSAFPDAETWFDQIVQDLDSSDHWSAEYRRALLVCLLASLARRGRQVAEGPQLSAAQRLLLESHVDADPAVWPSIPELARTVALSADYVSRVFRRSYGMTPRAWLVRRRILLARSYLRETTHSVGEIADLLGYRDIFYFSTQFKQVVGHQRTHERRKGIQRTNQRIAQRRV
jgi:AraC-like DNA-binding protein